MAKEGKSHEKIMEAIRTRLIEARKNSELSQEALGDLFDPPKSYNTIGQLERGNQALKVEDVCEWAQHTGKTVSWFFEPENSTDDLRQLAGTLSVAARELTQVSDRIASFVSEQEGMGTSSKLMEEVWGIKPPRDMGIEIVRELGIVISEISPQTGILPRGIGELIALNAIHKAIFVSHEYRQCRMYINQNYASGFDRDIIILGGPLHNQTSRTFLMRLEGRLPVRLRKEGDEYYFDEVEGNGRWRYQESSNASGTSVDYGCLIRCRDVFEENYIALNAFGLKAFGTSSMGQILTSERILKELAGHPEVKHGGDYQCLFRIEERDQYSFSPSVDKLEEIWDIPPR